MKLRAERHALARMYIDLTLAFHDTAYPVNDPPDEIDADLALVAVAVMLGHAADCPMNASQIAVRIRMPRSSVRRRLKTLIGLGLIRHTKGAFCLDKKRAQQAPRKDGFERILAEAFVVLGPYMAKLARRAKPRK